jgi:hypothetical protein
LPTRAFAAITIFVILPSLENALNIGWPVFGVIAGSLLLANKTGIPLARRRKPLLKII